MALSSKVLPAATNWSWVPGAAIALLALIFTVGSFWWMNARRGRLSSYAPHSFAAGITGEVVLLLRLPLVFFNSGAKPIVVQDLRLVLPSEEQAVLALPWRCSREQLKPESTDGPKMPSVFAVPGGQVRETFIEFGGPFPDFHLEARDYVVRVEALLGHKVGWHQMVEFTLRAGNIVEPGHFLAYSNAHDELSDEDRVKTSAALEGLLSHLTEAERKSNSDNVAT